MPRIKNYLLITVVIFSAAFLLHACFSPKTQNIETNGECNLKTKKLTLSYESDPATARLYNESMMKANSPEEALAVVLAQLGMAAGSYIVSGSVVAVNNTIHWIEQNGKCQNIVTQNAIEDLKGSVENSGVSQVDAGQEIIDWFRQHAKSKMRVSED